MAPESISTAYFINLFYQSAYTRQRFGKHVPVAANARNNIWTRHFLYGPCLIKGECVDLCIAVLSLCSNSVKAFQRQRRIVGSVVFYAVRFVSKANKGLVLPRTCLPSHIEIFMDIHIFYSQNIKIITLYFVCPYVYLLCMYVRLATIWMVERISFISGTSSFALG
jgi:hypothetical protein